MKQGDVYRNNHTGLEYVVEVKDIMSHDTPVAKAVDAGLAFEWWTSNKSIANFLKEREG